MNCFKCKEKAEFVLLWIESDSRISFCREHAVDAINILGDDETVSD